MGKNSQGKSLLRWLPCAIAACLLLAGCHSLTGSHEPGMYEPSAARDEAIRKKADKDPFTRAGEPQKDAVLDTPTAVHHVR